MKKKNLEIEKIYSGYFFSDKQNPDLCYEVFYDKESGVKLLKDYVYKFKKISYSNTVDLLEELISFNIPITSRSDEDQLRGDLEALEDIYEFREGLKIFSYMVEGEKGLPKLKIVNGEGYIIGEDFISESFRDKETGLLIAEEHYHDKDISEVEYIRIRRQVLNSSLSRKLKVVSRQEKVKGNFDNVVFN